MKKLFKLLKLFWQGLNFIRNLVMNVVFLFFTLFIFAIWGLFMGTSNNNSVLEGDQGALLLNLDGYLIDNRADKYDLGEVLKELNSQHVPRQISTFDLVYVIKQAADDERIRGIVLDLNQFEGADLPAIKYVGAALNNFKKSGKSVIAYSDSYTQTQYVLASYADQIYLNPVGTVSIQGLSVQNFYYKDLLDKLKITPHIFRVGTYKSAVEPFLRNDMSPEAKANLQRWASIMWSDYKDLIAQNRQISDKAVLPDAETYFVQLKNLKGDRTAYAKQQNFITHIADRFELEQKLIELFGKKQDGKAKLLPFDDYLSALPDRIKGGRNNIAVINVEGTIIDGETNENGVGGDSIAKLLRQAYEDAKIKAIILRVNSPGGSAFASEIIRQEIVHLKQAGKPVVVSMGAMAASGGYWISSNADYIFADADTITGSIGIFAMFPTFERSIAEIGINSDGVITSELAQQSMFKALPQINAEINQLEIEHGYDKFLTLVSEGRGLSKSDVDKIAQGQVWLGSEALEHKLIDEIGNFDRAVEKAKELVYKKLPREQQIDLDIEWLVDKEDSLFSSFFYGLKQSGQQKMLGYLPKLFTEAKQQLNQLNQFNDPKGQYLYCLTCGSYQ